MTLAALLVSTFSPIHFVIGFVIMVAVIAIVIVGVQYLLSLGGIMMPKPLLTILSITVFLVLFMVLLNWSGLYTW